MSTEIVVNGLQAPVIGLDTQALKTREEALARANTVLSVNDAAEQRIAVEAMTALKSLSKRMESSREIVKKPVLEIGRKIDNLAKDFTIPIDDELKRLSFLVSKFQKAEMDRVVELKRQEEIKRRQVYEEEEKLKAILQGQADKAKTPSAKLEALQKMEQAEAATALAVQESLKKEIETSAARVAGMIVKKSWKFEVLDVKALFAAQPLACTIEPNNAVIRGLIAGGLRECPGLRIYEDVNSNVRA
jgi:hypothetical protein